jgi:hypothetical protein
LTGDAGGLGLSAPCARASWGATIPAKIIRIPTIRIDVKVFLWFIFSPFMVRRLWLSFVVFLTYRIYNNQKGNSIGNGMGK